MRNEDKEMAFNKKKNAEAEAPEVAQEETPVEENQAEAEHSWMKANGIIAFP